MVPCPASLLDAGRNYSKRVIYHDPSRSEYIPINQQPGYLLFTCVCLEILVDLFSWLFWRTLVYLTAVAWTLCLKDCTVLMGFNKFHVRLDYQFAAGSIGYRKVKCHGMRFSGSLCTHTMALGITGGFPIRVLLSYGTPVRIRITYWRLYMFD